MGFPGARRPLEEAAKLGMMDFVLLEGERIAIPDADVYIFSAWHPVYERLMNIGGRIGVLWSSSCGEMDFTPIEQLYLRQILTDPRISFVWFGDRSLAKIYPEKGFYAPYPFVLKEIPPVDKKDIITLFCPTGPKKNLLNNLYAVKLAQRQLKLTLHTNIQGYGDVLKEIDHVRHGFLPRPEYDALLASAKVNLMVSWAETYAYNVAEAALQHTPSITSATIPIPGIKVEDPNDPAEIATTIIKVVTENRHYSLYATPGILSRDGQEYQARNLSCQKILEAKLSV